MPFAESVLLTSSISDIVIKRNRTQDASLHQFQPREIDVQIEIKRCNNIENGSIKIIEGVLNIKYAINGTGKSTIAKAISAATGATNGQNKILNELTSFKYLGTNELPEITGIDQIASIKVFDERYINEFVFQADELLKGSFDIFIRDDSYESGMAQIDLLVASMRNTLSEDQDIASLIQDFNEISNSFGKPTKTGIHGASNLAKALKDGNKVANIPTGLEGYKDYIQHTENYKWIKWQLDGKNYIDISHDCPYCTNDIKEKKETIRRVSEVYEPKSIENLNKIVAAFERLNKYFSDETNVVIDTFIKNINSYSDDQIDYLKEVKDQIDRLNQKFVKAQSLGFASLKDVDKVMDELKAHKIDLTLFNHLKSENTNSKVLIVNKVIDELLERAGELQGGVTKQNKLIEKLVKENSAGINGFLKNAGYKYQVKLTEDATGRHKLKLVHNDITEEISNAKAHLSFGERNAFSLVLFMYDALKSQSDLIVLDDPISSFDKNKKYAIIEMLFRKGKSFRGKTVLLLTHDFDPIVDMVHHHSDRFDKPFATFLENKHGVLTEKEIQKTDVKIFIAINRENVSLDLHEINRLVYLRRLFEVTNNKKSGYDLISNLFHKRDTPTKMDNGTLRDMTPEEISEGSNEIKDYISSFNYAQLTQLVKSDAQMKALFAASSNNYEKLHIYRIIFDGRPDNIDSDIIQKFINEAFHIENNYIYQLNPCEYQLVPQYVIDECERYVDALT